MKTKSLESNYVEKTKIAKFLESIGLSEFLPNFSRRYTNLKALSTYNKSQIADRFQIPFGP